MKRNMNHLDQAIRLGVGILLVWLTSYVSMPSYLFWAALVVGIALIATGILNFSFIYWLFKINTHK